MRKHAVRVSLCAIALDEQELIADMLASVRDVVDEIVLGLDTRTTDRTREIAEGFGARVIEVDWRDDFSYARNLTIEAAGGDWVLVLDADDRLTPVGAAVVRDGIEWLEEPAQLHISGLMLTFAEMDLTGLELCRQFSYARLFRNRPEIRFRGRVHENPVWLPDPARGHWVPIDGEPHIVHYGYDLGLMARHRKVERNLRLLEMRVAENPSDTFARQKLIETRAYMDQFREVFEQLRQGAAATRRHSTEA